MYKYAFAISHVPNLQSNVSPMRVLLSSGRAELWLADDGDGDGQALPPSSSNFAISTCALSPCPFAIIVPGLSGGALPSAAVAPNFAPPSGFTKTTTRDR